MANVERTDDGKVIKYAWPGGYPVYYLTSDDATLCADCVNENEFDTSDGAANEAFQPVASDINYESLIYCAHCNQLIESAYGIADDSDETNGPEIGIFTFQIGQVYGINDIPKTHRELLLGCSHPGQCDADVAKAKPHFAVDDPAKLREYLQTFGAWDQDELADDNANLGRLLWTLANEIKESGSGCTSE